MSQQVLDRPSIDYTKPTERTYPPLTTHDRCDAAVVRLIDGDKKRGTCGAQAFVRVVLKSGLDLLFCGHCIGEQTVGKNATGKDAEVHAVRRAALEKAGAKIINMQYGDINLKPSESSQAKGF